MDDSEDRYDRFVSTIGEGMTVHKTIEEAFAAHDKTVADRAARREARKKKKEINRENES